MNSASWIHYIPLFTTAFSIFFLVQIFPHWYQKRNTYLLWWMVGVFFYGLGTLVESLVTLQGWSPFLFKSWYIFGALLGGAPLAQGTVHLLMKPKRANLLSLLLVFVIIISSVLTILSPIDYSQVTDTHRLVGSALGWKQIRLITPFINVYAFLFLVGGALYSAWLYYKNKMHVRFLGNIFIAVGGLLPGIGGSFSKAGYTEVLYVTEFLGLVLIFAGYAFIRRKTAQISAA